MEYNYNWWKLRWVNDERDDWCWLVEKRWEIDWEKRMKIIYIVEGKGNNNYKYYYYYYYLCIYVI